jgi:hypothetical protein
MIGAPGGGRLKPGRNGPIPPGTPGKLGGRLIVGGCNEAGVIGVVGMAGLGGTEGLEGTIGWEGQIFDKMIEPMKPATIPPTT